MLKELVQDGKGEGCGLAGAGRDVIGIAQTGNRQWNGLGLDGGGRKVVLFLERTQDGIGEAEILKGGQKLCSFHKSTRPGANAGPRANDLEGHPRVWGRVC